MKRQGLKVERSTINSALIYDKNRCYLRLKTEQSRQLMGLSKTFKEDYSMKHSALF